jgi:pimeloyl-ACP methyl ester carboxylesterase
MSANRRRRAAPTNRFRLVQPSARKLAAKLIAAGSVICVLGASLAAGSAQAQITFGPCANNNDFACGHLTVPLDPSGAAPGTITLAIRRHRAPVGEARSAIIALAGGPGQPALPFAEEFAELLGPIAATRDLIVFDQRGIGLSAPLSCHAFERPDIYHSFGAELEACGDQLGSVRAYYTTADTVADIEAIREAGGYEKLVLYGTSYGTKVAERYAQEYPSHVEALVLDSVVPPNGPEPLNRSTFAAIPRILRQLCAAHACADVTHNPVADLARVVAEMNRGALHGSAINRDGHAQAVPLSSNDLIELLLAGDFSPLLRSELLSSVVAAARGDTAPLARLVETAAQAEGESEDFDTPLYYATTCEEQAFPFSRSATPKQRIAEALAAARALPRSAFAPFTADNALALSDIPACAYWPYSAAAPVPDQAPLPAVPTLILSGADDLRTPTANAREVAAEIPGAHLLVVPYTGHSVLTEEQTSCASDALQALFAQTPVKQCPPAPVPADLRPQPPPPTRIGLVSPAPGYDGLRGRTLHAVALTYGDFVHQLVSELTFSGALESAIDPTLSFGGLRSGWARFADDAFTLHGYSYIPGVTLSGMINSEGVDLRIGGPSAASGSLHRGAHKSLVGTLAGAHVALSGSYLAGAVATAAIVGADAQESSNSGSGDSPAPSSARRLDQLLSRIQP